MIKMRLMMPTTQLDADSGINDGNIETYKNFPMESLTKEEEQNSTDSAIDNVNKPVVIEYSEFVIDTKSLPDYDTLKQTFVDNRFYWDNQLKNDKKAIRFFDTALEILSKDKIRCLRISDFNTTGLTGIKESSGPWRNLVKNTGVSDKPGRSGGSFGIGKHAAFACSQLRLVFYNTINIENEKAFQGVLKLPTFKKDNDIFAGTGFYSSLSGNFEPVYSSLSLDPSFSRDESDTGMDKYIVGFDENIKDLKDEIIITSLNNFLLAFFDNTLIVKFGSTEISNKNLDSLLKQYKDDKRLKSVTKEYYETLVNPDKVAYTQVFEEKDIEIYMKLDPSYSRRAAIVRQTGMKVFDKSRLSGTIGFSAIIKLAGDKVNEYFKKLENAEHNKWSPHRAEEPLELQKNQDKIFNFVRKMIQELHQENFETSIDADGMNEYLPYSFLRGISKRVDDLTNRLSSPISIKKKKPTKENQDKEIIEVEPDLDGEYGGTLVHGDMPRVEPNIIPGEDIFYTKAEDNDTLSKKKVSKDKYKFRLIKKEKLYALLFQSEKNIHKGVLEIKVSGEQVSVPLYIKEAYADKKKLEVYKNHIVISGIKSKSSHLIEFSLFKDEKWALEVDVYEDKK